MRKLVFHVDVNSAFLSWEASKRVAEGQDDIRLIPSAIGGDPEKRTGIILAKSIPAKKYGIETGEPVALALRKCPNLYIAKPDFLLYERNSKAFMDICREYAPVVEKYSIDECFLDMSGTEYLYPDPVKTAHELKDKIHEKLGFTVNVGVGSNKLLAKMASDFEKPDKVHCLFPEDVRSRMWPLPVGELFTVGKASAAKLTKAYIKTIGDLANSDLSRIQNLIGVKVGAQLYEFANGRCDSPVLSENDEAKGYSISTTLEKDVVSYEEANHILLALADSVATRMRTDNSRACCVAVSYKSYDFKTKSHQKKLNEPTDVTKDIYNTSILLFKELWDGHTPLRLLGISLTSIVGEGDYFQASLFPDENKEKARKLDKTVDCIRSKFGLDILKRGSMIENDVDVGKKYKAQLKLKN